MPEKDTRSAPKSATLHPVVTAKAVHETLMSMHARQDYNGMSALFKGSVEGTDIMRLVHGSLVLVGDSEVGIEIVSAESPICELCGERGASATAEDPDSEDRYDVHGRCIEGASS